MGAKPGALGQHMSPKRTMAPCPQGPSLASFLILSPSLCPPLPHSICSPATDFQEPSSFRIILTISFYNHSRTQYHVSAWLDELQTHSWDSKKGIFVNKLPWFKGNFSNKELMEQERAIQAASIRIPLIFQDHVSQWQLQCEFRSLRAGGMEVAGVCVTLSSFFLQERVSTGF